MEFNATFLASIISFLVFVFLMNKILYAPMEKIVNERNSYINDNYDIAQTNHAKAEELLEEREEKLDNARDEAKEKYISTVNDFKTESSNIIKSAQENSNKELAVAYENLQNASNATKSELKGRLNELAEDIAEKVLGYRPQIQDFDDEAVNKILYCEEG